MDVGDDKYDKEKRHSAQKVTNKQIEDINEVLVNKKELNYNLYNEDDNDDEG